jgi:hypothetical protein
MKETKVMRSTTRRSTVTGITFGILLFLAVGCNTESRQKQEVTTTTPKGESTAPPSNEAQKQDNALIRVVNAIPNGSALDVFADDQKTFDNVGYKQVTPYKEVPDRLRLNFKVRTAGQDSSQPLAENAEMIGSGNHYTVIAYRDTNKQTALTVVNDNLKPPDSSKAKVRFINAAPDAGEVDVYPRAGKDAMFDGVNFGSEAGYREVDPMKTTLEVRPEGKKNILLAIPNTSLEAGKIYTIVLAGRAKGQKFEAITIEDQFGTPTARLNSLSSTDRSSAN